MHISASVPTGCFQKRRKCLCMCVKRLLFSCATLGKGRRCVCVCAAVKSIRQRNNTIGYMQGREYASLACSTPQFVSLTSLLLLPKPTMSIYARRRRDTTTSCSVFMRATAYSFFLSLSSSFASFTHPFDVPHPSSNFTIRVAEAIRASTTICC